MMAQPKASDLDWMPEVPAPKPKAGSRAPLIRRADREWLSLFIEQHKSGLSLADYCKPKGMSPTSFSTKRTTLLKKYGIEDLDALDLNTIDFSKAGVVGERVDYKNHESHEVDSGIAVGCKPKDKPEPEMTINFKNYSIKIPMSHDHEWVIGLLLKLMKINSEMED